MSNIPSSSFIVVGVDGSVPSKDALGWAVKQAQLTGAELRAVSAWHVPAAAYGAGVPLPLDLDWEKSSHEVLDHTILEVVGEKPPIALTREVAEGAPALVLLAAAEGADALVIGSRGHGAFTGMLLGSVSEHCVAHASCPVVVIHSAAHHK